MFGLRRRQGYPCCLCSTCCWWQQYGGGVNSTHIPRREEGQGDVAVVLRFLVHSWGHVSLEWVTWRSTRWTASLCSDVAFVWHLLDGCQGWEVVVGGWVGAQRWLVGGWCGRWGHTHQKFTLHLDLWNTIIRIVHYMGQTASHSLWELPPHHSRSVFLLRQNSRPHPWVALTPSYS